MIKVEAFLKGSLVDSVLYLSQDEERQDLNTEKAMKKLVSKLNKKRLQYDRIKASFIRLNPELCLIALEAAYLDPDDPFLEWQEQQWLGRASK